MINRDNKGRFLKGFSGNIKTIWRKGVSGHKGKHTTETKLKMSIAARGKKHYWNIGEKNLNWKGGITSLSTMIRRSFKYRQWRSDIFTRDNFTCVFCGKRGVFLVADHFPELFKDIFKRTNVKTFNEAMLNEEFWNINNGRTLCNDCHLKRHKLVKFRRQL